MLWAIVGVLGVFLIVGCGTTGSNTSTTSGGGTATSTPSTSFATTKFAFHAGLAFGAFHQLIYKPIKTGTISHPLTLLQAIAAGLFTYHEAKLAYRDAQSSQTLKALVAPFTLVINKINVLYAQLKGGQVPSSADVLAIQSDVNNLSSLATASGNPIKEMTPTTAQLAAGVAP
jgi:hypothetical protein